MMVTLVFIGALTTPVLYFLVTESEQLSHARGITVAILVSWGVAELLWLCVLSIHFLKQRPTVPVVAGQKSVV